MGTEQETTRMELAELGEFGLIRRLTDRFSLRQASTLKGVGDDCAVLQPPQGQRMLVTTDVLLEGVHFDLTYFPLLHLGYKAVVVNLSDVYAMNAVPAQITVSIGVSRRFGVEQLEELYAGIRQACEAYGVDLVGGDTSASMTGLAISITAIGYAEPEAVSYRHGAQVNDLLCVTGNFGAAYMGLQLLEREKRAALANPGGKPELGDNRYILQRMLRPEARKDAVEAFAKAGIRPHAMIDVSDGLSSELLHICHASHVGCRIYPERIPIDQQTLAMASEFGIDPVVAAMNGGEDYELLLSVPLDLQDKMEEMGLVSIGYVTKPEQGAVAVASDGVEVPIQAQGWNAFAGQEER